MDNNNKVDFILVLRFMWKWRFYILIFSILGGLSGAIFSGPLFITPKFKSTVIFYPTTTMSISRGLLSLNSGDQDFLAIGEISEAEQLMQILQSDVIMNKINEKYDLMDHYEISPDEKYANTKFARKFYSNVHSEITQYMSIKVSVLDKDPQLAANIANDIVEIMDTLRSNVRKQRAMDGLEIVGQDFYEKTNYVQVIVDSLRSIARLGVLQYKEQSKSVDLAIAEAILRNKKTTLEILQEKEKLLAKYGPTQEMLSYELEYETDQLVILRNKLKQIKIDAEKFVPHKFIIERAKVSERKAYPIRWVITVLAFVSGFIGSIVILIIIDNLKKINLNSHGNPGKKNS